VESELGQGTTFVIRLPIEHEDTTNRSPLGGPLGIGRLM